MVSEIRQTYATGLRRKSPRPGDKWLHLFAQLFIVAAGLIEKGGAERGLTLESSSEDTVNFFPALRFLIAASHPLIQLDCLEASVSYLECCDLSRLSLWQSARAFWLILALFHPTQSKR